MILKNGDDERRVPLWAAIGAAVAITAIPAGIAWGVGQARLAYLETKLSVVDTAVTEHKDLGGHPVMNSRMIRVESAVDANSAHRLRADSELDRLQADVSEIKADVKRILRAIR